MTSNREHNDSVVRLIDVKLSKVPKIILGLVEIVLVAFVL